MLAQRPPPAAFTIFSYSLFSPLLLFKIGCVANDFSIVKFCCCVHIVVGLQAKAESCGQRQKLLEAQADAKQVQKSDEQKSVAAADRRHNRSKIKISRERGDKWSCYRDRLFAVFRLDGRALCETGRKSSLVVKTTGSRGNSSRSEMTSIFVTAFCVSLYLFGYLNVFCYLQRLLDAFSLPSVTLLFFCLLQWLDIQFNIQSLRTDFHQKNGLQ